jgi:pyruvate dehydrogenase E2 component (dihydrolipoamide acetyltransferase)
MNEMQNIIIPKQNVNDEFVVIQKIFFKNGDKVLSGDIIAEIETSKTSFSIESPCNGFIVFYCNEGNELPVGHIMAKIFDSYDEKNIQNKYKNNIKEIEGDANLMDEIIPQFSNAAYELMVKHDITSKAFVNKGFIKQHDVLEYLKIVGKVTDTNVEKVYIDEKMNCTVEKINLSKRNEIKYLSSVQNSGLTCTFSINVNYDGMLKYTRKNHKIFKLSIIPTLIYEVAKILTEFPILNSYYENGNINKYNEINIGYAVDLNYGLKVVTLYNTNNHSVIEIEKDLQDKIDKYLNQTLQITDISNSTITISDLSNSGIHYFRPLINKDQTVIIGVSSVDYKLNSFNISLTFDHRVTEGKTIANFLNKLKKGIESHNESLNTETRLQKTTSLLQKINKQIELDEYDMKEQASIIKEILLLNQ